MIDRLDLFIAVTGVVASVVGSSTALSMALSKKTDKEDFGRLEARMDIKFDAVETRLAASIDAVHAQVDAVENRLGATPTRVDAKLDALILRLVPEQPQPRELGAGGS